jgi:tetratricopeptide (TPR) repeat protein
MRILRFILIFFLIAFYSCRQNASKHQIDPVAIELDLKAFPLLTSGNEDSIRKGINFLDSATAIDSNYFLAYHTKVLFLNQIKEYDKAVIEINNCIRIMPNAHDLYLTAGMMHENIGDTISSQLNFRKSLSLCNSVLDTMSKTNRDYSMLTTNKAINLIMLGDSLNANQILKNLYATQPDNQEFGNVEKQYIQSLMNKNKRQLLDSIHNPN